MRNSLKIIILFVLIAFAKNAYAGAISMPPNNLGMLAYWSFEDAVGVSANGTTTDFSGNGNDASFVGNATWTVNGKRGIGTTYDGSGDYLNLGNFTDLDGVTAFTVSAWFKTDDLSFSSYDGLFARGSSGQRAPWIYGLQGSSVIRFQFETTTGGQHDCTKDTTTLTQGVWHHAVFVWNGSTCVVYTDGVAGTSDATTGSVLVNTDGSNYIGKTPTLAEWDGLIDEMRIYNRALSATEAQDLYRSGFVRVNSSTKEQVTDGLVAHWTFDGEDLSGSTVKDVANSNNGTGSAGTKPDLGKIGQGYFFDGEAADVTITGDLSPTFDNDWTISLWGRFLDRSALSNQLADFIGNNLTLSQVGFVLRWNNNASGDVVSFLTNTTGSNFTSVESVSALNIDQWHHLVFTYRSSDGECEIWIDGVLDVDGGACASGGVGSEASQNFGMGGGSSTNVRDHYGWLDDVRVYDHVVSEDEVSQLYKLGQSTINKTSETDVTESNLMGHWTFDGPDITTSVKDVSGNSVDGYIIGVATSSAKTIGKIGQALDFAGDDDYVTIADHSSNSAQVPMSVSFWSKDEAGAGVYNRIFGKNSEYLCQYWTDNRIYCYFYIDADLFAITTSASVSSVRGEWVHTVLTLEQSGGTYTLKVYINGVFGGSNTSTKTSLGSTSNPLNIGVWSGYFNGKIDDFRIYDKTLTPTEVKRLYNMGR